MKSRGKHLPGFIKEIVERRLLYLVGLLGMGVGLPLGKAIISIGTIILVLSWLIDTLYFKDLKRKWQLFSTNPIAWSLTGIFLLHLVGMLYTTDFDYGIADLRTKLPLLLTPFIFTSMPVIGKKTQQKLVGLHYLAVICSMLIAIFFFFNDSEGGRLREHIHFISHIRLSLLIVMGLLMSVLFLQPKKTLTWLSVIVAWLFGLWFLVTAQLMTGLVILLLATGFFLIRFSLRVKRPVRPVLALILISTGTLYYLGSSYETYFDTPSSAFANQSDTTASGTPYYVPNASGQVENGQYVWQHYAPVEMEKAWALRSKASLFANNLRLHGGLTRYLTAKKLNKDKEGVAALSLDDISNIELGMVRPPSMDKGPLGNRLDMLFYEWSSIKSNNDPNGHSIAQRFEYWKTGWSIFKDHPILGVGTGDVRQSFSSRYEATNSPLRPEFRHRAHQQYLTIAIAFGSVGLLLFLFLMYRPLGIKSARKDACLLAFFVVFSLSFLNEDTLESQAGLTFYVFYMAILALAVGHGRKLLER